MILVDTHAHFYVSQFDEDRTATMQRAFDQGIKRIYLPNIDGESIGPMLELEKAYPEHCFAMMGLHPCSVKGNYKEELAIVEEWLHKRPFCAIGEIGIDLHWDTTFFEEQKEAFKIQINWAKERNIPIIIHSRKSTDIIIKILQEEKDDRLQGIFHCFGGNVEQAQAIIDLGFYLGIGGVLTFKKSGLDKTMESISLDHVVLETDSPYLAPMPFRGKRNESSYIHQIATHLASIKETTLAEVAEKTTTNALKIFNHSHENIEKIA